MMYIMRAHHLYDDAPALKLGHLIQSLQGEGGSIIFAKRSKTSYGSTDEFIPCQIVNHMHVTGNEYKLGEASKYTIDTGLGHKNKGYPIVVEGYINVDTNGQLINWRGEVPWLERNLGTEMPEHLNLLMKVNAWVFK